MLNKSIKFFIKIITRGRAAVIAAAAFFGKKSETVGNARSGIRKGSENGGKRIRGKDGEKG